MEKHTPGPWIAVDKSVGGAFQIINEKPGSMRVCTITNGLHEAANARLIAAAPDLLAAAVYALGNLDEAVKDKLIDAPLWFHAQLDVSAESLRAAIQKAKGSEVQPERVDAAAEGLARLACPADNHDEA